MFKNISVFFLFILLANSAFAIDKSELNTEFFNKFNDCYLPQYINEAIENNHSAKEAAARTEQYRQQVKSAFGNELPSLSAGAYYLGAKVPDIDNFQLRKNAFIVPFIVNYEADFLLKNRGKTKSAYKTYEVSKFDEKAVYLALLTDVASIYLNLLQYDKLITEQSEIALSANEILENDKRKFGRGVINNTTLNNSQKDYEDAKNNLETLEKQRQTALMEFMVLLGRQGECTDEIYRGSLEDFEYIDKIPDEAESDIIFSRPDIMAAEAKLKKAQIDINTARKEFFPRFNITGIWTFNTIAGGNFFSWESSLAALMAGAMQDIFAGGKKVANLRFQKAKYEELFENYRQTSLEAVKEINTALCIIKHDTNIDNNTKNLLDSERKNYNDAKKLLQHGVISNNDFLNQKRRYLNEEIAAAKTKTQRLNDYFTFYKAAGGKP